MNYFAEAGNLLIANEHGQISWTGRPGGYPVQWASPTPDTEEVLVLYAYQPPVQKQHGFQNLVRLDSNLNVIWRADLPVSDDVYVRAGFSKAGIEADSFEGYRVIVDINTGKIVDQKWTKYEAQGGNRLVTPSATA